MAKKPNLAHVEMLIARNETKLKRTVTALDKLKKQRKRLLKAGIYTSIEPANRAVTIERPRGHVALADMAGTFGPAIRESLEDTREKVVVFEPEPAAHPVSGDNLDIPTFLRRQSDDKPADNSAAVDIDIPVTMKPGATEQLKAELAEIKKKKAAGRIAKMKAKKAGDTKKMPLTGKAALDLIRNGRA